MYLPQLSMPEIKGMNAQASLNLEEVMMRGKGKGKAAVIGNTK